MGPDCENRLHRYPWTLSFNKRTNIRKKRLLAEVQTVFGDSTEENVVGPLKPSFKPRKADSKSCNKSLLSIVDAKLLQQVTAVGLNRARGKL